MTKTEQMATLDIKKLAFKISTPMIISMISIALYGIIDTMFISGISGEALTTISLSIPFVNIITAIGLGSGIGINTTLARALGEKNDEKVNKIIFTGIILTVISWIIVTISSFLGLKFVFSFFTDNEEIRRLNLFK